MPNTRFPKGVTNVKIGDTLGHMPVFDSSSVVRYFEDFSQHCDIMLATPTSHTVTLIGAGTVAFATVSGGGGHLLITNAAADNDQVSIQHKSESFKYVVNKPWSIKTKFRVSDATQSDILVGVAITDTTPLDASDRIAFEKADGSTTLSLKLTKNSTSTTVGSTTLVDATDVVLGARYVPSKQAVEFLVNEVVVGSTTTLTNLCDDEELTPTISLANGEAVAKTMTMDYIDVCFARDVA